MKIRSRASVEAALSVNTLLAGCAVGLGGGRSPRGRCRFYGFYDFDDDNGSHLILTPMPI